jgi:hypothetical protein
MMFLGYWRAESSEERPRLTPAARTMNRRQRGVLG